MTYFANGSQLGKQPPQAATNGFGRMPPQASTNGLGRYGRIGMMPPQAQAGVGSDMTPSGIPEGPMTAWRDGIFGARRQPEPFGDQLYPPWRDGIFGPSLGEEAKTTSEGPVKASTVALIGVGAVGIGLLAVMLKPKKYRANRKRKKGGRRKKTTRGRKSVRGVDAIIADLEREPTKRDIDEANRALRKLARSLRDAEVRRR